MKACTINNMFMTEGQAVHNTRNCGLIYTISEHHQELPQSKELTAKQCSPNTRPRLFQLLLYKKLGYRRETARQLPTAYLAPFLRYGDLFAKNCLFLLPLSHSAPSRPMFPLEFCGEVNHEETRVMGPSSSEDRMIVAGVVLA